MGLANSKVREMYIQLDIPVVDQSRETSATSKICVGGNSNVLDDPFLDPLRCLIFYQEINILLFCYKL